MMRAPLVVDMGGLVTFPVAENKSEIKDLCGNVAAAVGMYSGDDAHVSAVLAEAAEFSGVEEVNVETELIEETRVEELLEDVLFLHARRIEPHIVPFIEEGESLVVGPDVEESSVDGVSSFHVVLVNAYLHIQAPVVA